MKRQGRERGGERDRERREGERGEREKGDRGREEGRETDRQRERPFTCLSCLLWRDASTMIHSWY